MPTALIILAAGINCDEELAEAFSLAGARVEAIHLNRLLARPDLVDDHDLIGLPGGFSFGDAVAAGRIAAQLMRRALYPALRRAIERGVPMIAPCNGFQIAVQIGLLPGPPRGAAWPEEPPVPTVGLAANRTARFVDRWVRVEYPESRCIWTRNLDFDRERALLPVAHGEGRFLVDHPETFRQLEREGQIVVRYAGDDDPNGSLGGVAGICDESGLVFGLMPHPERYTRWTHHPFWTRLPDAARRGDPPGLAIFRNAVEHARAVSPARVRRRTSVA
jgi:phosphoribosylformylglycinamidine synthase